MVSSTLDITSKIQATPLQCSPTSNLNWPSGTCNPYSVPMRKFNLRTTRAIRWAHLYKSPKPSIFVSCCFIRFTCQLFDQIISRRPNLLPRRSVWFIETEDKRRCMRSVMLLDVCLYKCRIHWWIARWTKQSSWEWNIIIFKNRTTNEELGRF